VVPVAKNIDELDLLGAFDAAAPSPPAAKAPSAQTGSSEPRKKGEGDDWGDWE